MASQTISSFIELPTITTLDLKDKQIDNAGVQCLVEALKRNTTLTELDFTGNKIGRVGAQYLAEALKHNTTLTTLDLRENQIGDVGVQYLTEALHHNTTLTTLELQFNRISEVGIQYLVHTLKHNTVALIFFLCLYHVFAQCIVQTNSAVIFSIIGEFVFILFNGAIAPLLLCIFGLLILYDKKKSRQRVLAQQQNRNNFNKISNVANRQNKHMITMLLVQVSLTIIFNIPNIVIYMISYFNMKSYCPMPLLILIIFNTIGRWFHYMNYCKTFYINTLTSSLFRKSLRKQYQHIKHHRIIITITTIFPINRNIG
ncbi:unnamed protein product [Adineta steineri]|uniref:Uncharacterized protein n=1 Tax=Adineta steineri TaxID=433720 RepID=A0A815GGS9_9BILA|nr:unnamed protein product [Adineta steineri]